MSQLAILNVRGRTYVIEERELLRNAGTAEIQSSGGGVEPKVAVAEGGWITGSAHYI